MLFLPLVRFVVPRGEIARVVTTAVASFFLIAFTMADGVRQIDRLSVEAARHHGARGRRLFTAVLVPGALPFIFTGRRLGLGDALIVVVAVEIVRASRGLGALLWLSRQVPTVEDMYATLVVIAALGGVLSYGLTAVRPRLLPWAQDVAERRWRSAPGRAGDRECPSAGTLSGNRLGGRRAHLRVSGEVVECVVNQATAVRVLLARAVLIAWSSEMVPPPRVRRKSRMEPHTRCSGQAWG